MRLQQKTVTVLPYVMSALISVTTPNLRNKMFCWRHDWVKFREPEMANYIGTKSCQNVYRYSHDGIVLGTDTHSDAFSDYTCSKCNKMDLKLEKALVKARKREMKKNILAARRNAAKLFALRYIDMADKTKD